MVGNFKTEDGRQLRIIPIVDFGNCSDNSLKAILEEFKFEFVSANSTSQIFRDPLSNELVTIMYSLQNKIISIVVSIDIPDEYNEDQALKLAEWLNRQYRYRATTRTVESRLFLFLEYLMPVYPAPIGFSKFVFVSEVGTTCNTRSKIASALSNFMSRAQG
jgi:hypothetical protein